MTQLPPCPSKKKRECLFVCLSFLEQVKPLLNQCLEKPVFPGILSRALEECRALGRLTAKTGTKTESSLAMMNPFPL